ncbi:hypothetical protein CapIbe_006302 [Capra ibex]
MMAEPQLSRVYTQEANTSPASGCFQPGVRSWHLQGLVTSRESNVGHQQLYWGHLRNFSEGSRSCWVCSNRHGLIRKHCLSMGHQYFRQYMKDVGCVKSD